MRHALWAVGHFAKRGVELFTHKRSPRPPTRSASRTPAVGQLWLLGDNKVKRVHMAVFLIFLGVMLLSCSGHADSAPVYKVLGTETPDLSVPSKSAIKNSDTPTKTPAKTLTPILPSKTPFPATLTKTIQNTATDFPEELSYSYSSPDGNWIVHESLGDGPHVQVTSKDGKTKWIVGHKDVEPIFGAEFNWTYFCKDAIYFGIGPENYEIQVLQRFPPSYSLYRLDLADGSISSILAAKNGQVGLPIFTYFDLSGDENKLVYSRWYEHSIIIQDLRSKSEKTVSLPEEYLIAGAFSWSPNNSSIVLTMWKDDYALSTDFAVVRLDVDTLTIKILLQDKQTKYFLVPVRWFDENNILLEDRRYGNYYEMNVFSGNLTPHPTATVSP
jgi:hypothetical protein